jgi:hypothetical protein
MISIGANGQKIAYGIKHYNIDTEEDLRKLPVKGEKMGCTCFVIETSKYYMLNSERKWIEITPFGKVVSSGEGGDIIVPPDLPSDDDIIYEGGII